MDTIEEALTRGVEKIYPSKKALEKVLRGGKKIKLYQGFDPSMPNLHLGHLVGILKLKQFQDLGHKVIFLVGDFTGMIGDPTERAAARPRLTRKQVLKNCQNWKEQAGKILSFEGENPAKFAFNSAWLDKVTFKDLIKIAPHFTAQQILERDFFQRRLKDKKPIFLHEFLYPVAQAIDCVEMDVDLEVGGSDQTFNMLAGRSLMKALKGKEKYVLTTKLLVDAKGEKVGKTAGNALFLDATPIDMYGGVMSFPDEVIIPGFELLTCVPLDKIKDYEAKSPMEAKKALAFEIIKMYHGENQAKKAQEEFKRVFQEGKQPSRDIPTFKVSSDKERIVDILVESGTVGTASEAKRLIRQKGVDINGKVATDVQREIPITSTATIVRVGKKKFIKVERK